VNGWLGNVFGQPVYAPSPEPDCKYQSAYPMSDRIYQNDLARMTELLLSWIARRAPQEGLVWLETRRGEIAGGAAAAKFFTSFSAVPRYAGKDDLELTESDLEQAAGARPGWQPVDWSVDQAGRTLLFLALPHDDPDAYFRMVDQVLSTADVGESVAFYQSLPLLPHPERYVTRAKEGLRSNIAPIFNAIALRNPFPAERFDDEGWNQLVLKAVFIGSPLHHVEGLDRRANPALARMLVDYVRERWAAGREVTPEVWRLVGPYAADDYLAELEKVLDHDDPVHFEAAALALAQASSSRAEAALERRSELKERIERGELTWADWVLKRWSQ
jgi:hypothetical protein